MADGQNVRGNGDGVIEGAQEKQQEIIYTNFLEQGGAQNGDQNRTPGGTDQLSDGGGKPKKHFEWHGNRQQERRRKDNIQACITRLANLVPACSDPSQLPTKLNQGLVLKYTTQYIRELEATNRQLIRLQQGAVQQQLVSLQARIHHLKCENQMLRVQLGEAPPSSMLMPPPAHDMLPKRPRLEDTTIAAAPPPVPPTQTHFSMGLQS